MNRFNARSARAAGILLTAGLVLPLSAMAVPGSAAPDQGGPPPHAVRISDEILDPAAHAKVTYEGSVNVASFQQDGLTTIGNQQYTAWYPADGRATVSRRTLPDGDWHSIELDGFLAANDSHNTISMGVSRRDGRLHLALGTHGGAQLYIRSVPGLIDGDAPWTSQSFESVRGRLPFLEGGSGAWTYPQFETVDGHLMLTYREGSTNNGRQALARYNDDADGTWTYLGLFTGSTGTYTSDFGSSSSRYAYLHGFAENPVTHQLEISYSWREQSSAWCSPSGLGNHDLGYASSSDGGLTWDNNAGQQIGATGTNDLITIDDPSVVVPIDINRGLINQEAQTSDSDGRIHVMTSGFNDADLATLGGCHTSTYSQRAEYARPYHHWRDGSGTWHSTELPFYSGSSGRTKLLFDKHDTAYLVLPDGRIAAATAKTQWSDWAIVFSDPDVKPLSETIVDRQRLERDGVLSVAYVQQSKNGEPSQFRVADFRIKPGHRSAPRDTAPQQAPAAYDGSAIRYPHATASSSQPGYPAGLAVDGATSSFWVSGGAVDGQGPMPGRPETLTVDYGRARQIGTVTIAPRPQHGARELTLAALVDGTWTDLGSYSQADAAATFDVPDVSASELRVTITSAYDVTRPADQSRNVQIAEVSIAP